jgi:hypothetical protein
MSDTSPLLSAYFNGVAHHFDVTKEFTTSYFGGPLEQKMYGPFRNSSKLHQIAVIGSSDRPDKAVRYKRDLPLLYGLRFSGCDVAYQSINRQVDVPGRDSPVIQAGIVITELWPDDPTDGWPYPNFPRSLPYLQIKEVYREPSTWSEFGESIFDGRNDPPAPLVFAMTPPSSVGVSIWGRDGDMEGVVIVWEIDPETDSVRAYNRCT